MPPSLNISSFVRKGNPSIKNSTKVSNKPRKLVRLEVDFIPQNKSRWEKILADPTTDRDQAEQAILACYDYAGLDQPQIFWADNPLIAMKISIDRPDLVNVGSSILSQIWSSCNQEIESQITPEFISVVKAYANPRAQIIDAPANIAFDPLGDFLNQISIAEIQSKYPDINSSSIPVAFQDYRIAYLSYFDYFHQIGLNIPQIQLPINLAKSCGCCWAFASITILTPKPSSIEFSNRGELLSLNYDGVNILN